jgi:hypothetical protein
MTSQEQPQLRRGCAAPFFSVGAALAWLCFVWFFTLFLGIVGLDSGTPEGNNAVAWFVSSGFVVGLAPLIGLVPWWGRARQDVPASSISSFWLTRLGGLLAATVLIHLLVSMGGNTASPGETLQVREDRNLPGVVVLSGQPGSPVHLNSSGSSYDFSLFHNDDLAPGDTLQSYLRSGDVVLKVSGSSELRLTRAGEVSTWTLVVPGTFQQGVFSVQSEVRKSQLIKLFSCVACPPGMSLSSA